MKKFVFVLALVSAVPAFAQVGRSIADNTITKMYEQIRMKEAEASRNEHFQQLLQDDVGLGSKITSASIYFKSMDSQFDDQDTCDEIVKIHRNYDLNDFTDRLTSIYKDLNLKKMSPLNGGKKYNNDMAFYALAAALDQKGQYGQSDDKKSMYDLIKEQLKAKNSSLVGMNREMMIELLKARVDIMSAVGIKAISSGDESLSQKMKSAIFKITGGNLGSLEINTDSSEGPQKDFALKAFKEAAEAKRFLAQIDVNKSPEKKVDSILSSVVSSDEVDSEIKDAISKIQN